jgi:DNA-binding transcriptional ArsR family regulator
MTINAYSNVMGTTKNNDSAELDYLFDQVAGYMQLFAEPTRLRIMHTLCDKECSVNEVVEAIGATQTNVSRHLSAMHKSRVLARRKEGTTVYYTVSDPKAVELCRTVCMNIISNMDEQRITHKAANQFMAVNK